MHRDSNSSTTYNSCYSCPSLLAPLGPDAVFSMTQPYAYGRCPRIWKFARVILENIDDMTASQGLPKSPNRKTTRAIPLMPNCFTCAILEEMDTSPFSHSVSSSALILTSSLNSLLFPHSRLTTGTRSMTTDLSFISGR